MLYITEELYIFREDGKYKSHETFIPRFAGQYLVECIAPVWNSNEYVNKTAVFTVEGISFKY